MSIIDMKQVGKSIVLGNQTVSGSLPLVLASERVKIIILSQTTANLIFTIPVPNDTTVLTAIDIVNKGTTSFVMYGLTIGNGATARFSWNGTSWVAPILPTSFTPTVTISSSGTSQTLAFPATGNIAYDITLTANCTLVLSGGSVGQLQVITLFLRQDSTAGRVATLPTSVQWAGGTAPTPNITAGKIDVFKFTTPDGAVTTFGDY